RRVARRASAKGDGSPRHRAGIRVAAWPVSRRAVRCARLEAVSVENGLMRVLIVVHGFPPAAQGGAEVYAHAHAKALRAMCGDEIFVIAREQDPNRAEYALRAETRDGLQIAWVNNTFPNTRSLEDSYRNDAIGAIAARLIDDFKPDVAHVHHLTCLSTSIV